MSQEKRIEPLAWWKRAVAYQIYPRSFYDSNHDGIGDLQGIIDKLDYLADLGIDLLWICPFYQSPNDDNGYDISDYQAIHPMFGTLDDLDRLIALAHQKSIRIILDLVINHTSDEHPWFIESRSSRHNPKRDWYIWREGQPANDEKPTDDPNNWESIFHGSAWAYDAPTDQYYLHLFSKKQPDLNWENPEVREALYAMIHWWLDRGIDGFRVDAISHIHKKPGLPSLPNPERKPYVSSFEYHMNVPGIEPLLFELKERAFAPFDIVTVGEANGVTADQAMLWVEEKSEQTQGGVFNMIFQFEHLTLWAETKENTFDLVQFKTILSRWQDALEEGGWNALYLENHDQPRSVSILGDVNYWYESATSLALCYFLMKGTPFIYQGQEIGMTNHTFASIDDFQDVSAKNLAKKLIEQGQSESEVLALLNHVSRDHSRTPMQWDDSNNAGFSTVQSWIETNPNAQQINVKQQLATPHSVYHFYKQLIQLRKSEESLIVGRYQLLLPDDPQLYIYQRITDEKIWTIVTNLSPNTATVELHQSLGTWILDNQHKDPIAGEAFEHAVELAPYAAYLYCQTAK